MRLITAYLPFRGKFRRTVLANCTNCIKKINTVRRVCQEAAKYFSIFGKLRKIGTALPSPEYVATVIALFWIEKRILDPESWKADGGARQAAEPGVNLYYRDTGCRLRKNDLTFQ